MFEDFIDVFDADEVELIADGSGDLIEVTFVLFREEDLLDPELAGGKHLFLESADGEDFAGEGEKQE